MHWPCRKNCILGSKTQQSFGWRVEWQSHMFLNTFMGLASLGSLPKQCGVYVKYPTRWCISQSRSCNHAFLRDYFVMWTSYFCCLPQDCHNQKWNSCYHDNFVLKSCLWVLQTARVFWYPIRLKMYFIVSLNWIKLIKCIKKLWFVKISRNSGPCMVGVGWHSTVGEVRMCVCVCRLIQDFQVLIRRPHDWVDYYLPEG